MNPDDTQTEDADVTDAVATLLRELPKPVQDFITGPERSRIALSLSQKYGLHVDQAGEFEIAFIHMLLGVSTPEEFAKTLAAAGIPPSVVASLAADVNEQVFMPLRKAEQGSRPAVPAPAPIVRPAAVPAPALQPVQPFVPVLPAEAVRSAPEPVMPDIQQQAPVYAPQAVPPYPMQPQMPYMPYGYAPQPYPVPGQPVYMPPYQPMNWQMPPQPASLPPQTWMHTAPLYAAPQPGQPNPLPTHAYQPAPAPEAPHAEVSAAPTYEKPPVAVPAPLEMPQVSARPIVAPVARTAPEPVTTPNLPPLTKSFGSDPYREPV